MGSERPKIAESLEVASNHDLVHIDRAGRVRSPLRLRAIHVGYYGLCAALLLTQVALVARLFERDGSTGAVMGALVALTMSWVAYAISRQFALRRALRAIAADRSEEAERIYRSVLAAKLLPAKYKTAAEQGLVTCDAVAGRHEEALAHAQSVLRRLGRARSGPAQIARYSEVILLVNVGQLDEARAKLEELGPIPEGEYFRIQHWSVELYVALAQGTHTFDEDELHVRAKAALAITSAAGLLGLLAWAFDHLGDEDMTALLLDEARDRHPGRKLSGPMPLLEAWMTKQPAPASDARADEDEDEEEAIDERATPRSRAARRP